MYAASMWKHFRSVPVVVLVVSNLASCNSAAQNTAAPVPEVEQVVGTGLKELYIAASLAAPPFPAQHTVISRMAEKTWNGKELLLVIQAAEGVSPTGAGVQEQPTES